MARHYEQIRLKPKNNSIEVLKDFITLPSKTDIKTKSDMNSKVKEYCKQLREGSCFKYPIVYFRLQTKSSSNSYFKFKFNDSNSFSRLGNSGIFELSLDSKIEIYNLRFDSGILDFYEKGNADDYMILDIIYED